MRTFTRVGVISAALLLSNTTVVAAQTDEPDGDLFPTSRWCADSGTACWSDPGEREWLNGIRFLAEIDLAILFQGGSNRFEGGSIRNHTKLAVEVNLYRSWVALQLAVIAPSKVTFDNRSDAVDKLQNPANREINTDWGGFLGLSFFDSSIALGAGLFRYDRRDFKDLDDCEQEQIERGERDNCLARSELRDRFIYFAFQPVSTLRANLKGAKENSENTPGPQPAQP